MPRSKSLPTSDGCEMATNEACQLIKSQRGGNKLHCAGYFYVLNRHADNGRRYYWRCERRRTVPRCTGSLVTYLEGETHFAVSKRGHSHLPNGSRKDIMSLREKVLSELTATDCSSATAKLIQNQSAVPSVGNPSDLTTSTHTLPSLESLRKRMGSTVSYAHPVLQTAPPIGFDLQSAQQQQSTGNVSRSQTSPLSSSSSVASTGGAPLYQHHHQQQQQHHSFHTPLAIKTVDENGSPNSPASSQRSQLSQNSNSSNGNPDSEAEAGIPLVVHMEVKNAEHAHNNASSARTWVNPKLCCSEIPVEPATLDDLIIEGPSTCTLDGRPFLMKDFTAPDGTRLLVFATHENIQHLASAATWILDGTAITFPHIFAKLYTVLAEVGVKITARMVPLVYCLMSSHTSVAYTAFFQTLQEIAAKEGGHCLSPDFLITDFDQDSIHSMRESFPNSECHTYIFHLSRVLWRYVQQEGLESQCQRNLSLNLLIKQLIALAFLPSWCIRKAYEEIRPLFPKNANHFLKLWEDNYIYGPVRKVINGVSLRTAPLFAPSIWSIATVTPKLMDSDQPWNSYTVETYHQDWTNLVSSGSVGVYHILNRLRKMQATTEEAIGAVINGQVLPDTHKIESDHQLKIICSARCSQSYSVFLNNIASLLP